MTKFKITAPDGNSYYVTGPEGSTEQEALAHFQSNWKPQQQEQTFDNQPQPEQPTGKDYSQLPIGNRILNGVGEAAMNLPASTGKLIADTGGALLHPIDTAQSVLNLGNSALQKVLPDSVNDLMHRMSPDTVANAGLADKFAEYQKGRYGSLDAIGNTLRTDPAGALSDASMLAGGVGLAKLSRAIDPLANTAKIGAKAVDLTGKGAANLVSALGTHTGAESIGTAARAGAKGGQSADDFLANLRGDVPKTDVLDDFKAALQDMRIARSEQYNQGMTDIGQLNTPLDFTAIDSAVNDAFKIGSYKGKSIDKNASGVKQEITSLLDEWRAADPQDFHTAEGLDALKRGIGDIRDATQHGTPGRVVSDRVYNSVRDQVKNAYPEYEATMKDYEDASRQIKEIERSFSLGEKASADTAMRKLQSLMRNNVNTNYGTRLDLMKELEAAGGANLSEKLAGQALNSWAPRGFGNITAPGIAGYGVYAGNPAAVPMLAIQSPRLMGEAAYYTGKGAGLLGDAATIPIEYLQKLGINPGLLGNAMSANERYQQ